MACTLPSPALRLRSGRPRGGASAALGRLLAFAAALLVGVAQAAPTLPAAGRDVHLGAASCAGSACHGAGAPNPGSNVLQNEFLTWQRQDPHSGAYRALTGEAGQRIARNLGLNSAVTAECMGCHTDAVARGAQGARWKASDGVACEGCHGGSQRWLGLHVSGLANQQALENAGLYPTHEPAARAALCLSCHQSSAARPLDHRLYAAGHPPLNRFELDTYTATEPAHYRVDGDYRRRKAVASGARTWLTGLAAQSAGLLDHLARQTAPQAGPFPEFSNYDCDGCHHPMSNVRWSPGAGGTGKPGELRVADTPLTLLGAALTVLQPTAAAGWQAGLTELRKAGNEPPAGGALRAAAQRLQAQLQAVQPALVAREPTTEQVRAVIAKLVEDGSARTYGSYLHAAQTTQAISALVDGRAGAGMGGAVSALFKATADSARYEPGAYRSALAAVQAQAAGLK